ncbi:MAG: DNA cytosine methyltransferase [Actinomycetaceae bacterium]|nr:DNA cytosine methyltransferase [Actinomycetaceae bacterium]
MTSQHLSLGSLFDGSGGFPLAALNVGITPVWASEVEPYPIIVTRKNLPEVEHLGDVSLIHGGEIPPVDVITFGSPCQDLSVAGKQSGLAGERSSLFFEAVRIIKEMRQATNGHYPRYAIWENVPGAFSSQGGKDFQAVLTTLTQVTDSSALDVPIPEQGWSEAGVVVGSGFSIAWRVLDAQYFGLAQRRRRIYLACDFAGGGAPEILFDTPRLSGNLEPGSSQKQNHAPSTSNRTPNSSHPDRSVVVLEHHPQASRLKIKTDGVVQTLTARMGNSPTNVPILLDQQESPEAMVFGLNSIHLSRRDGGTYGYEAQVSKTLDLKCGEPTCNQGGMIILQPQQDTDERIYSASKSDFFIRATPNQTGALLASDYTAPPLIAGSTLRPRRLTPLECARLQGFPDHWCQNLAIIDPSEDEVEYWEGVWGRWNDLRGVRPRSRKQIIKWLANPGGDRAEYKLWGNGIALPVAEHVLKRLAITYQETTGR